ncbi:MAG: hypothetical protein JWN04_3300 [Myxococcaceae bacterium]|nr:hypothetical protein [Myxococcaceae bacterium]
MPSLPRISVCFLSYNHAAVLRDTLQSVLAQSFEDFELIVSDDRSRDASWEIIQELANVDHRIRAIRPDRNVGMAENANFAVAHARASYVALLHHDDICRPDLLQRWFDLIDQNDTVGFVSNAFAIGAASQVDYHPFQTVTPGVWALEKQLLGRWDCPVRGTGMIRKSAWVAVGGMRPRFGLIADVDLWMRLAAVWDVGYIAEPLLTVQAVRPEDYPDDYVMFSWNRLRLLFEIHGVNREEFYSNRPLRAKAELLKFRLRLGLAELRWLGYAIVKRRPEMLLSSDQVENVYELGASRLIRRTLQRAAQLVVAPRSDGGQE